MMKIVTCDTICKFLSIIWTFFSVISQSNIISINKMIVILKIVSECDFKHIMTLTMNQ